MRYWLAFLLVIGTVYAASSFTANITASKDIIYQDEVAYFVIQVKNTQTRSDLFTVSTPEFDWFLDLPEQAGELTPGETEELLLGLSPKESVTPGSKIVRVKVRSANTNDFEQLSAIVTVKSLNGSNRTYAPSVFMNAQVPPSVDPRDGLTVSVYMRNRNARVYDKLTVALQSDLFTKTYVTSLGPIGTEGEKTNEVTVVLDPDTPPGTHPLTVSILVDGITVNEYKTQFSVATYKIVNVNKNSESKLFKTTSTYTVDNNGNTAQTETIIHPSNIVKRLFTAASIEYNVQKSESGSALAFSVSLEPQQQVEFTVVENFRLLAMLILLLILSTISYYIFRSPVVLRKEAMIIGGGTEGVSEIKIRLFVKNRSTKQVSGLHIVDRATSMADVVKEASLGTLQPTKIVKKKGHGTLVRWDIDTLDAFEERIITYRINAQLRLIGDVYLPAAKARFDQRGRERNSYSNEVNIPRDS